jgi:thioredoxin-dependent peroxiredoxin
MQRLSPGDTAPDFELRDAEGATWRLAELQGKRVILYFYPADDTPGCTAEACDFRDTHDRFAAAGYTVLGVSAQGQASHRKFASKHGLNFPLLIDEGHATAAHYGVRGPKRSEGDAPRSTFVIDEDGKVVQALYGVKAKGHVDNLRELLHA